MCFRRWFQYIPRETAGFNESDKNVLLLKLQKIIFLHDNLRESVLKTLVSHTSYGDIPGTRKTFSCKKIILCHCNDKMLFRYTICWALGMC